MTKRSAEEMEARTSVYLTRVSFMFGELTYEYARVGVTDDELAFLVSYQEDAASAEALAFLERMDDLFDEESKSDHFERCEARELMEKPGLHFICQGQTETA